MTQPSADLIMAADRALRKGHVTASEYLTMLEDAGMDRLEASTRGAKAIGWRLEEDAARLPDEIAWRSIAAGIHE